MANKNLPGVNEGLLKDGLILSSLAEGICVVDSNGIITYANNSAAKLLGYELHEVIGKEYRTVLFGITNDQQISDAIDFPVQFALTEGETLHINDDYFRRKNGDRLLVEYIVIPLRENNLVVGAIVSFEDITERRDLEIAVAAARDAALKDAQAKAAFLANVSHEIRTPLNGIIGTADLILSTQLTAEQKRYFDILKSSAGHLLEIVNDLLDLSKLEAQKIELHKTDFDLRQLIDMIVASFSQPALKKELSFRTEIADDIPRFIHADDAKLRQILNNLISNAIKFTRTGGIVLKLTRDFNDRNGSRLRFEVIDTGIGIAKENLKSIFEPFEQAEASTAREFGGTGLGLAISKEIVELMGGEISVESEFGKGSNFWFTIDAKEIASVTPEVYAPADRADSAHSTSIESKADIPVVIGTSPQRILLVEDNPFNREIASAMLKKLGFDFELAEDGRAALAATSRQTFDVVLMDCGLPDMDGFETTRRLRQQETGTRRAKIIALTASAYADVVERCREAGMDGVLTKPITRNDLQRVLSIAVPSENAFVLDSKSKFVEHPLSHIIDGKVLADLVAIESGGVRDFVFETFQDYLSHIEKQISLIESSTATGDFVRAREGAHGARGSSANMGITELQKLFGEIEMFARNQNLEESRRVLEIVNDRVAKLRDEFPKIR